MSKRRLKWVKKKVEEKPQTDVFEQPEFADENMQLGRCVVEKMGLHQVYPMSLNLETLKICGGVTFQEPVKLQHCEIPKWLCPNGINRVYHIIDKLNFDNNVIFLGGLYCDDVKFVEI